MARAASPQSGAKYPGDPIVDWLNRQPPARKRLYTVLLVIPFLTIPCYITGFALLAAGAPVASGPQLATATATHTAAPIERTEDDPPTATEEPPTSEPTIEVIEPTPTEIVIVVTATTQSTETATPPTATETPLVIATPTATTVPVTPTTQSTDTPAPTTPAPIETETPSTPSAVLR